MAVSAASPYGPGGGAAGTPLASLQAQLNSAGGAGSGQAFVNPSDPLVRLQRRNLAPTAGKPLPDGMKAPERNPAQVPLSQAQASIYGWSQDEWSALAKRLWYLGYDRVSDPSDIQNAIAVWQDAVTEAAKMQAGGHDVTPDDVLNMYAAANGPLAAKRANGEAQTQKVRSISLTDPVQAKALITQAFQQAMGRNPTDAEVNVLTDSLHKAQRANPTITTGGPLFDNNGNEIPNESRSVVQQGLTDEGSVSAFIQQAAMANPEAAQYQAGTFYFNTLMKALGSPVG